jgi:hypothetical protein
LVIKITAAARPGQVNQPWISRWLGVTRVAVGFWRLGNFEFDNDD